jgi:type I restriction enzyme S subunit
MNSRFSKVQIREVAVPVERLVAPLVGKIYRQVGVRLWGQGAYEREPIDGGQTRYKTLSRLEAEDILVNKIWARNGSVAVVQRHLAGAYVSPEFPTFAPIRERILPRWFHWLTKTKDFWKACDEKSMGTSGKNRIKPERFLDIEIPLPPLAEQNRILTLIEQLSSHIQEIRILRNLSAGGTRTLFDNYLRQTFESPRLNQFLIRIGDANLRLNSDIGDPERAYPNGEFTYLDISSIGAGPSIVTRGKVIPSAEAPSRARRVIHTNDVIFSTVRPNLRAVAKIGEELDNQFCSTGFAVFSCDESLEPDFLLFQLYSPFFVDQCISRTTGGHYPAINEGNLREVSISIPPMAIQRAAVSGLMDLKARLDGIEKYQTETSSRIDALLPLVVEKAFNGDI